MRFIEWYPYYLEIAQCLHIQINRDIRSSLILSDLIDNKFMNVNKFKRLVNRKILIIGAGPSIEDPITQKFIVDNSKNIIICADGATELCLKLDIIPDFIVTDLDGDIKSLINADNLGSKLIIHAHGNNIDKISKFVPQIRNVFGTTQVFPLTNIYNFGGFTDGDRCVFLADEFQSREIWLIGMDFNSNIGLFSKKKILDIELKRKKLSIGKYLIEMLAKKSNSIISNVTISKYNSSIDGVIDYKLT